MKKMFVLASTVALFFSACKKENGNPDNGNVAKQLKKITRTEAGQTTVYNLNYDGSKRLLSLATSDNSNKTTFTYDANGNVVEMEIIDPESRSKWEFTYQDDKPRTGTLKSWDKSSGTEVLGRDEQMTYMITNNTVTTISVKFNNNPVFNQLNFNVTYEGANVKSIASISQTINFSVDFAWGTKKSPILPVFKHVLDWTGAHALYSSTNELLVLKTKAMGGPDITVTNQYTYDADGYPLTMSDGDATYKFEY